MVESMLPREAFLGMDSVFTFEGAALEATSGAVRVRFTKTTCEESVATATLVEKTATVRFESAEEELRVCVAYGEGTFALVEPTVKVYGVSAVTPAQVTVGKTTELRLSGVGIAEGDEVRVVSAGSACDSTPMGVGFVTDGAVALYVMSGAADVVDVCYSFNQFDLGMTKQPVTLAVVESAEPEVVEMEGARLVSFVGVEKKLRFAELEIDDKVSWTDAADCSEMVMEPVRVNENKEVTVEFSAGADELLLCVCTNGVDFVLQSNVTMAVVSVSGIDVADMVLGLEESVAVNGTGLAYAVDMYFVRVGERRLSDVSDVSDAVACSSAVRVSTIASVVDGKAVVKMTEPADLAQLCVSFEGYMARGFDAAVTMVYMDAMAPVVMPLGGEKVVELPLHNVVAPSAAFLLNEEVAVRSAVMLESSARTEDELSDVFTMDSMNLMTFDVEKSKMSLTVTLPAVYEVQRVAVVAPMNHTSPRKLTVLLKNAVGDMVAVASASISELDEDFASYELAVESGFATSTVLLELEGFEGEEQLTLNYVTLVMREVALQQVVFVGGSERRLEEAESLCAAENRYVSSPMFLSGDNSFTLVGLRAEESATLCYKYGEKSWLLMPEYTLRLGAVSAMAVQSEVVVANQPAEVSIEGVGIASGDEMRFVLSSAASNEDCYAEAMVSSSTATVSNGMATVTFARSGASKLCYNFGGYGFVLTSVEVQVKEFREMRNTVFVVASKPFVVEMVGTGPVEPRPRALRARRGLLADGVRVPRVGEPDGVGHDPGGRRVHGVLRLPGQGVARVRGRAARGVGGGRGRGVPVRGRDEHAALLGLRLLGGGRAEADERRGVQPRGVPDDGGAGHGGGGAVHHGRDGRAPVLPLRGDGGVLQHGPLPGHRDAVGGVVQPRGGVRGDAGDVRDRGVFGLGGGHDLGRRGLPDGGEGAGGLGADVRGGHEHGVLLVQRRDRALVLGEGGVGGGGDDDADRC